MGITLTEAYRSRRILVTGHTGFKGSWLSFWLKALGAEVHGLALQDGTVEDLYAALPDSTFASETIGDIRDSKQVRAAVDAANPDFVFHLAAQPLVRRSYREPRLTIDTNVMGTVNLLETIRIRHAPCRVIVVTSDKCYENLEKPMAYREDDRLGGRDIYSASKAAADILASAWARSFFAGGETGSQIQLAIGRAGNVIGGGDFAEDRIVPDCVRALRTDQMIEIRNPHAIRPWQHVLDCLHGYLRLGIRLGQPDLPAGSSFNFGPNQDDCHTVGSLVKELLKSWPGKATFADRKRELHEANTLLLSAQKSILTLDWRPNWNFEQTVKATIDWYRFFNEGHSAAEVAEFSFGQIAEFQSSLTA